MAKNGYVNVEVANSVVRGYCRLVSLFFITCVKAGKQCRHWSYTALLWQDMIMYTFSRHFYISDAFPIVIEYKRNNFQQDVQNGPKSHTW